MSAARNPSQTPGFSGVFSSGRLTGHCQFHSFHSVLTDWPPGAEFWCRRKLALEAGKLGYKSIELLQANDIKLVKQLGLTCAVMSTAGSIVDGLNRKENHEAIEKQLRTNIDFAAAEGIPNVLVMSGNRKGMPDDEGLANCARTRHLGGRCRCDFARKLHEEQRGGKRLSSG